MPEVATKPKEPRKRQKHLPTMEPPSIPEIDKAAEEYVEARDERMAMTEREVDTHDTLLSLMRENGLTSYEFDDHTVTLETKAKCRVKRKKDPEAEGDGDPEEAEEPPAPRKRRKSEPGAVAGKIVDGVAKATELPPGEEVK